jgi:murein DD-endopeptidase MepM/ murein hydrolase activator NlpD
LPSQNYGTILPSLDDRTFTLRTYVLKNGDTVSEVAGQLGLEPTSLLAFNEIKSPRVLRPGLVLKVPDRDGIAVRLDQPSSVSGLALQYHVFPDAIRFANRLSPDRETVAGMVLIPGVTYSRSERRVLLGEQFLWPTVGGRISSFFGRRNDPFTGAKTLHSGLDIANYLGAPVLAARDGVVESIGFDSVLGNHIVVKHDLGYVTVYGHLSAFVTHEGAWVKAGQLIGRVGATGYATGPHVHFSAYHWGRLLNPMTLFG